MTRSTSLDGRNRIVLIADILMTVTTLRATSTGAAPSLDTVRSAHSLTTAQTGLLTTLSLLAFVLIPPSATPVARRFGTGRSLFAMLPLICVGVVIRPLPSPYLSFSGTTVIDGGIALGSILLPGLTKRGLPHSVARLTNAYSLTTGTAAALGSVMVVSLAFNDFGWQGALLMLTCSPLLALFLWPPQWRSQQHVNLSTSRTLYTRGIWRLPLAWQVTLLLGINSLAYYVIIGWLPATLVNHGYSEAQAGSLHGLLQLATAASGLLIPLFLYHVKDQHGVVAFVTLICTAGTVELYSMPAHAITQTLFFGSGSGVTMTLGLTFIGLRTSSAHQAAALLGMAQSVGYLPAACGPPLMDKIHDTNSGRSAPLMDAAVLSLPMAIFGLCAGRGKGIRQYPVL